MNLNTESVNLPLSNSMGPVASNNLDLQGNNINLNNMICNISPRGFTIFSLEDIRIKQAHMYFKDKLPFEIIIIIGKKWAILS